MQSIGNLIDIKAQREKPQTLHLRHPVLEHLMYFGEGADSDFSLVDESKCEPVEVDVLSAASTEYVQFLEDRVNAAKDEPDKPFSMEEAITDDCEKIAGAVKGLRGLSDDSGRMLDGSKQADRIMFCRIHESFRRQVEKFSVNQRNFYKRSSTDTSSSPQSEDG